MSNLSIFDLFHLNGVIIEEMNKTSAPSINQESIRVIHVCLLVCIKRLLHDIFHIGPGISPRLPYEARQRSWRAEWVEGWYQGPYGKFHVIIFLSHIVHWPFPSINFYIAKKIYEQTNCENKSLRELPLFNLQIFLFRIWFQKYTKQCWSVQWR
jgi:hypothetical protein